MKTSLQLFIVLFGLFGFAQAPALQWQKVLGGTNWEIGRSIQQTADGGYIVAGESNSTDGNISGNHGNGNNDFWVVKLDDQGSISWQKSLGGTGVDYTRCIQQTSDGGYIVAGYTSSNDGDVTGNHGGEDVWVVKLDNVGNIVWQKALGGTNTEIAQDIQQTTDGGYIFAGATYSNNGDVSGHHGNNDVWVVKLDGSGNISWQKALGGTNYDYAYSVQQTTDGGYIVGAYTQSNNGDVSGNHGAYDAWVVKLDTLGAISWQKALGGTGTDEIHSIRQTTDGGYIFGGYTLSNDGDVSGNHGGKDIWVVKLDNSGNISWQKPVGGTNYENAYNIKQTSDGGYVVVGDENSTNGDVTGNHGDYDAWIVKLDSAGTISWQKTMGGTYQDYANDIYQTSDGGYVVAGGTFSTDGDVTGNHGGVDSWILKFRPDLGNESFGYGNAFRVYPNPAASVINVMASADAVIENIGITDVLGKKVFQTNENTTAINVEHFQKGVYFIEIAAEGKKECVAFLKN